MDKKELSGTRRKVLKLFISLCKERDWLEKMAMEGWFLANINLGVLYTFQKDEPRRMLYEVDRFNLPQKPTLEEIRHKEVFLEMAAELGWSEITHDEDLNYYFCKEYVEGEINELYNDEESRRYRGEKFAGYFSKRAREWNYFICFFTVLGIVENLLMHIRKGDSMEWVSWFFLIYVLICSLFSILFSKLSKLHGEELGMSRQEWAEANAPAGKKQVRKLILTMKGLNKFLGEEAAEGWILTGVTATRYAFVRSEATQQTYSMDSKWLTNKRLKNKYGRRTRYGRKLEDKKDWTGLNNDWQLCSVKEAEEKGWIFVCALENRAIIYRGNGSEVLPLNDEKYSRGLRGVSLTGDYVQTIILAGIIGGIIGFVVGFLTIHMK